MNRNFKKNIAKGIVKISKDVTKTAVNKSVFIAAYEPELSEGIKKYCKEFK